MGFHPADAGPVRSGEICGSGGRVSEQLADPKHRVFSTELDAVAHAKRLLARLGVYGVDSEVWIAGRRLRVDLRGFLQAPQGPHLPDGVARIFVEVKPELTTAAAVAGAVFQAASYADALGCPVFVGPLIGAAPVSLACGDLDRGTPLSALQTVAGRLNISIWASRATAPPFSCFAGRY